MGSVSPYPCPAVGSRRDREAGETTGTQPGTRGRPENGVI